MYIGLISVSSQMNKLGPLKLFENKSLPFWTYDRRYRADHDLKEIYGNAIDNTEF